MTTDTLNKANMLRSAIHDTEHQITCVEKAIEELKKLPDEPTERSYLLEASIQLGFVSEDFHIRVDPTKVPLVTILTGYIAGLRKDREEMQAEFDKL